MGRCFLADIFDIGWSSWSCNCCDFKVCVVWWCGSL